MYVNVFFPPWNVRFKCCCFLFSPFLPLFRFLSVSWLYPLTQRFLRAALIFAARGHYQLIDYFDCYLIPPWVGIRGAYVQIESLFLSVCSAVLSFFRVYSSGVAADSQNCELSTHQSPTGWSSGNRDGADGGTSGSSCFRFTLPSACFHRPHFRYSPEAVKFRGGLSPLGVPQGSWVVGRRARGLGIRGQGKSILLPPRARSGAVVCHHTHDHTHM